MFLVVMLSRLFVLMVDLSSQLLFLEVKRLLMNLLKQFSQNISTVKKIVKKHFNKNLVMIEEEEHLFQESNSCWICKKLIDNDKEKVRDLVTLLVNSEVQHIGIVTNFQLTKKIPVIFYNLKGQ